MPGKTYKFSDQKIIIKIQDHLCDTPEKLVSRDLFKEVVKRSIETLKSRKSFLLEIFESEQIEDKHVDLLLDTLKYLVILPINEVVKIVPSSECFLRNNQTFFNYIEFLYDYWRSFERFIVSMGSSANRLDQRPYRTFNSTVEQLTHLVRKTYRDIQENIIYEHPNVYRQVRAGAAYATIAIPKKLKLPSKYSEKIEQVGIMRQILLNPPIVLDPPMNKRTGKFLKVDKNPIDLININPDEWLCYPVKVGDLTLLLYFHEIFYELGFSTANLFEIATDEDLEKKPDGVYFFGVQNEEIDGVAEFSTIFHDDKENDLIVAAIPGRKEFGYYGYLKKMLLTMHNVIKMKQGKLPYHGSFTEILMEGGIDKSILIIGDSGAGKSETLEAFRTIGGKSISDIIVIADDMGSLNIENNGAKVIGYGTEIGAFLRLDDLSPASTFGAIDRAIFMNVNQVNSRVVIPITTLYNVNKGTPVDILLYANNYEEIDEDHPLIEPFKSAEEALETFRKGNAMAKGTTTAKGLQSNYFVNPFGVPSYLDLHDELAKKYFQTMFDSGVIMGQIRTRLGIKGMEKKGPEAAASELIKLIKSKN